MRFVIEAADGRLLDGNELARIAVVLDVGKRPHEPLVPADPAHPPADHVEPLGHRMDFDADVDGSRAWRESCWAAVEAQHRVGRVLDHDELVLLGKGDDPFVELRRRRFAGRAVRVVQDEEFWPWPARRSARRRDRAESRSRPTVATCRRPRHSTACGSRRPDSRARS